MKLSRESTLLFRQILDQWLPPVIRDSRLFMLPLFFVLFGRKAPIFMNFKKKVMLMEDAEYKKIYAQTRNVHIQRRTDINRACQNKILRSIQGTNVLDIACGHGYLSRLLSERYKVSAVDLWIQPELIQEYPQINFQVADLTRLPFASGTFDTVVCAHTLEHIPNIQAAVDELKRVARQRLIVIVPCQRPYEFTFDLHVHFFPYPWSLWPIMADSRAGEQQCTLVDGDWFCVLDFSKRTEK